MSSQTSKSDSSKQETVDLGIYYLDLVECPLNTDHKLRRHRLPYHLLKCRKNYPDKLQCPYGHYFYVNKHEMASHLQTCPNKPRVAQAEEMQPHMIEAQHARNKNIIRNYDVDNYKIDEPYWD